MKNTYKTKKEWSVMDNEDLDLAKANAGAGCALIAFALFVVPAVFGVVMFFGAMIWSVFQ